MSNSLSGKVYEIILERILDNRLPAGEIINRRAIADELNVSVAPVLEALLMLEKDGLLETLPRKGTRVTVIRRNDVSGHLFVREALEVYAARYICGEMIAEAEPELRVLAVRADDAPSRTMEYYKADIEFHTALVSLCRCDFLDKEYGKIARLGFFYRINSFITSEQASIRQNHQQLLEQLMASEPEQAQKIMRSHIVSGKGDLVFSRE